MAHGGGGLKGGSCKLQNADVVLTTVGLASRWYSQGGIENFREYGAVILDEFGAVEGDLDYSLIFELVQKMADAWEERGWYFFRDDCNGRLKWTSSIQWSFGAANVRISWTVTCRS